MQSASPITIGDAPTRVPPPSDVAPVTMSDGATILLRRYSNPGRPRLALSHGNGLAIDAYAPFWVPLAADFELVVFDLRNHGRNALHDASAHTWPRIARDMGEILAGIDAAYGAQPTFGVFHSLSAVAALMAASAHNARYAGLVLFDPPLYPPEGHRLQRVELSDMNSLAARTRRRRDQFDAPEQLAAQFARAPAFANFVPGAYELLAEATLRPDPAGGLTLACPKELEARIFESNVYGVLWERLPSIPCPLAFVGADPEHPFATPPSAITAAVGAELVFPYRCIPGTTHFLQIEQPEACRAALRQALAWM